MPATPKALTGLVRFPSGVIAPLARVRFTLSAPATVNGTDEVAQSAIEPSVQPDGTYAVSLYANADLLPAGTFYAEEITVLGRTSLYTVIVTGNGSVASMRVSDPPTLGILPTAPGMYFGAGVPGSGLGFDGAYYFRSDGVPGNHIYFRSVGAWAALI